MDYIAIKHLHVGCVGVSISLFCLRGAFQFIGYPWRKWVVLRVVPHIVDTVLLGSAIWLATLLHQYPFVHGWLTAKLLALIAYIAIGKHALSPELPNPKRLAAFVVALLCVTYIVGVAVTHSASWGVL